MKKILLVICLIYAGLQALNASEALHGKGEKAITALHEFSFHSADTIIQSMERQYPDHYLPHLTRAHYYWWKMISQESEVRKRKHYLSSLEKAEQLVNQMVQGGAYDKQDVFHFINLYAMKARLDLLNGEYRAALRHVNRCVRFLKTSLGYEENFEGFYLTSGLYNYMTDYATGRLPLFFVYALLYPRGDMEKGIAQLNNATRLENLIVRTEAHYFLMKIFLELEKDFIKALPHARWLTEKYPGNLIYLYHYYQLLSLSRNETMALDVKRAYHDILQNHNHLSPAQRNYLLQLL